MKAIVDEKRAWLYLCAKIVAIVFILWLLFGVFFGVRRYVGISMTPYVADGDLLFYTRLDHDYKSDDVVLYKKDGKTYLARIIALLNETVRASKDGFLYVNNEHATYDSVCNDDIEINNINMSFSKQPFGYFLLNDNTDDAEDSRTFGRVEEGEIYGKVITIIRTRRP